MPKAIQPITLTEDEKNELKTIVNQGYHPARLIKRAQVLLYSHAGKKPQEIVAWLDVCLSTIYHVRQRYLEAGLAVALCEKARSGQPAKLDLRQQAAVTLLACSEAPLAMHAGQCAYSRIRWSRPRSLITLHPKLFVNFSKKQT